MSSNCALQGNRRDDDDMLKGIVGWKRVPACHAHSAAFCLCHSLLQQKYSELKGIPVEKKEKKKKAEGEEEGEWARARQCCLLQYRVRAKRLSTRRHPNPLACTPTSLQRTANLPRRPRRRSSRSSRRPSLRRGAMRRAGPRRRAESGASSRGRSWCGWWSTTRSARR